MQTTALHSQDALTEAELLDQLPALRTAGGKVPAAHTLTVTCWLAMEELEGQLPALAGLLELAP